MVLITDSYMTKEEEDKFKNIEIIKSDLFDVLIDESLFGFNENFNF